MTDDPSNEREYKTTNLIDPNDILEYSTLENSEKEDTLLIYETSNLVIILLDIDSRGWDKVKLPYEPSNYNNLTKEDSKKERATLSFYFAVEQILTFINALKLGSHRNSFALIACQPNSR